MPILGADFNSAGHISFRFLLRVILRYYDNDLLQYRCNNNILKYELNGTDEQIYEKIMVPLRSTRMNEIRHKDGFLNIDTSKTPMDMWRIRQYD